MLKRLLLVLVLILGLSTPAWATWTLAQAVPTRGQCGVSCTTVSSTFGSTPTTGNLMVAFLIWADLVNNTAGTVAVKDANNVAFTITTNSPSNARATTAGVIYCAYLQVPASPSGAITATFNTTGAGGFAATLWVMEFAPTSGSNGGFDMDAIGTGTTGTSITTPTITQAQANDLFVFAATSDHQVSSVDSPWTQVAAGAGVNQYAEGIGYILAQSSSQSGGATQNTSSGWDSIGASFKFTAAGGSCTPTLTLLGVGRCG